MITVTILINGHPIHTRSAVNKSNHPYTDKPNRYEVDDGTLISHIPKDGAVELAKRMLDTIKEVK